MDQGWVERRQVALQINHGAKLAGRIVCEHRLEHPVGPARMVRARHQRLAARLQNGVAHGLRVGRHQHRAAIGLNRAPPDMHDHRLPADIGQGLVGEPCRFEPGGYNDEAGHHDLRQLAREIFPGDCQRLCQMSPLQQAHRLYSLTPRRKSYMK